MSGSGRISRKSPIISRFAVRSSCRTYDKPVTLLVYATFAPAALLVLVTGTWTDRSSPFTYAMLMIFLAATELRFTPSFSQQIPLGQSICVLGDRLRWRFLWHASS